MFAMLVISTVEILLFLPLVLSLSSLLDLLLLNVCPLMENVRWSVASGFQPRTSEADNWGIRLSPKIGGSFEINLTAE